MKVEVVYRKIVTKNFRGKNRVADAKAFCKALKKDDLAEDIQAFEVDQGDGGTAWFDVKDGFKRHEMDG